MWIMFIQLAPDLNTHDTLDELQERNQCYTADPRTVCARACVRGRGGALLSLIGMFTNLSNANIKVSSWLLKGTV